ncbi:MAG: family 78 glycoside hydrolase catalytic domain, partial [Kiritimatiellae bacterium]|nr:family 78 glycoside hydrolase catalytic domain [Kiritimatiellia bacterium]
MVSKFSLVAAISAFAIAASGADSVVGLSLDHMTEPGDRGPSPSFAWRMESARQGAAQAAYRICVFADAIGGKLVWDSSEVADGRSVGVSYAGEPLKGASRYAWKVSVKNEKGEWSDSSPATFTTGLFGADAWSGSKWISAVDSKVSSYPSDTDVRAVKQEAEDGTSCFVKTIPNGRDVKEAWLAVSGLGVFEAYVNGKPVSRKLSDGTLDRDFLKPGFTHCFKTRHFFTYDVTHLVKKGARDSNAIAAQVSAGWWRDKIVNFHGKKSAFRAVLTLRHEDGSTTVVGTDESWLSAVAGPVVRAAIFDGEDYDARADRLWMYGSGLVGFKASEENAEFKGSLVPMEGFGVCLRRDLALAPREMYVWKGVENAGEKEHGKVVKTRFYKDGDTISLDAGETLIVDFGQNAAMVPEFAFSAAAGTTISMLPAEMLNDGNGAKSRGCDGPEGSIYRTSYRRARTVLNYTFAGKGEETYQPEFTFFGGRYASITTTGRVRIARIRSIPVTSVRKSMESGSLVTGVADVNRLVSNALWGQYSNYLSVPTDCPQRNERLGWTADT